MVAVVFVAACSTVRAQQAPVPQVRPLTPEAGAAAPPSPAPEPPAPAAAQASGQEATARPAAPSAVADRRDDIKLLEGVLNAAVKNGADKLALQMRVSEPGSLFVIDAGRTRGFDLQGYGVFFDVDVPMMKQSVLWSTRELTQQDRRMQLQNYVATLPPGPARELATNELRRMQQQGRSMATPVTNATGQVSAASTDSIVTSAAAELVADPRDPNELYTEAVKTSLIDAMLKYSVGLKLEVNEWLTVAARDAYGPPIPGQVDDASTIIIRIKGSDLAAFHGNKLTRDEVLKKVEVREF